MNESCICLLLLLLFFMNESIQPSSEFKNVWPFGDIQCIDWSDVSMNDCFVAGRDISRVSLSIETINMPPDRFDQSSEFQPIFPAVHRFWNNFLSALSRDENDSRSLGFELDCARSVLYCFWNIDSPNRVARQSSSNTTVWRIEIWRNMIM